MNEELICPHCGAVQETGEPDEPIADMIWTQCEKCGKNFWYSASLIKNYNSWVSDWRTSKIPEAKSLRLVCSWFPITIPPQDDEDRRRYTIHEYCEAGARKIEELQAEVERLKVFEEYCANMKELKNEIQT